MKGHIIRAQLYETKTNRMTDGRLTSNFFNKVDGDERHELNKYQGLFGDLFS